MKNTTVTFAFIALALGLSGCGPAASNSANSNSPANKANTTTSSSPAANSSANAAAAPVAKQDTPPKADFTLSAEDLHKDYDAMFKKDPASIGTKYGNKNIQITGTITGSNDVQMGTGSGTDHAYTVSGNGKDPDAYCVFNPATEESSKLAVGQKVTLQGTQTSNQNIPPRLEKCFVIKGAQ